jgi:hypothetical protein
MKKETQVVLIASMAFAATSLALLALAYTDGKWKTVCVMLGILVGMSLQAGITRLSRIFWFSVLMLSLAVPDVTAQEPPEKFPAYQWDTVGALHVSMPVHPDQAGLGVIGGAVCIGVAAGLIGYVAAKVISACLKVKEFIVTNNAACGECPQESPIPTEPVPLVTGPRAASSECACDAPPAEEQPLPVQIEHSFDGRSWAPMVTGPGIGSEFMMPDTGYWRLVPLPLIIESIEGQLILHAPPGVLEHSDNLRDWTWVSTSRLASDIVAEPGFYRVRLN